MMINFLIKKFKIIRDLLKVMVLKKINLKVVKVVNIEVKKMIEVEKMKEVKEINLILRKNIQ